METVATAVFRKVCIRVHGVLSAFHERGRKTKFYVPVMIRTYDVLDAGQALYWRSYYSYWTTWIHWAHTWQGSSVLLGSATSRTSCVQKNNERWPILSLRWPIVIIHPVDKAKLSGFLITSLLTNTFLSLAFKGIYLSSSFQTKLNYIFF